MCSVSQMVRCYINANKNGKTMVFYSFLFEFKKNIICFFINCQTQTFIHFPENSERRFHHSKLLITLWITLEFQLNKNVVFRKISSIYSEISGFLVIFEFLKIFGHFFYFWKFFNFFEIFNFLKIFNLYEFFSFYKVFNFHKCLNF